MSCVMPSKQTASDGSIALFKAMMVTYCFSVKFAGTRTNCCFYGR